MRIIFVIYAVAELLDISRNVLTIGALRGLSDTFFPTVTNILCLWAICLPADYILSEVFGMGLQGIALGQCIGVAVSNIPLLFRWYKKSNPQQLEIKTRVVSITSNNELCGCIKWPFWKKSVTQTSSLENSSDQAVQKDSKSNSEFIL